MLVETCVINSSLFPYLEKCGYTYFLSEDGLLGYKRITIKARNFKSVINFLKSNPRGFVFVEPLSVDALKYAILDERITGIVLSPQNLHVFKKTMLNLIRQYDKPVEVQLKNFSSLVLRKFIIWSYKWIMTPIVSSCAEKFNEIWSPISKISLLVVHGADEEEAIHWIYFSPQKLLSKHEHF